MITRNRVCHKTASHQWSPHRYGIVGSLLGTQKHQISLIRLLWAVEALALQMSANNTQLLAKDFQPGFLREDLLCLEMLQESLLLLEGCQTMQFMVGES